MSGINAIPHPHSRRAIGRSAVLALLAIGAVLAFTFWRSSPASAHCDSTNGPVVGAARQALEQNDVRLVLPYVKPDQEKELTAAFQQVMVVRQMGGEAQSLSDRYFFETAVRLHRVGEGASYTGLKDNVELDPALEAAEAALQTKSLDDVYNVINEGLRKGVEEHFQAVLDAREAEAKKSTVENARARVEAELMFEKYIVGISDAIHAAAAHEEAAAPAAHGH